MPDSLGSVATLLKRAAWPAVTFLIAIGLQLSGITNQTAASVAFVVAGVLTVLVLALYARDWIRERRHDGSLDQDETGVEPTLDPAPDLGLSQRTVPAAGPARFSVEISGPPKPGLFDGEQAAYLSNVWVINHADATLVLEFTLTLSERDFPAVGMAFGAVRFKDAMAFHEVYRDADEAVRQQYLSNPLSLDAGTNRMGSLAFLRPDETLSIPDQQYEDWTIEVRDVHADTLYEINNTGRHSFG